MSDQVVYVDTVGFVESLPHGLVQSFASTLEAARESDVLLLVVDCASARAVRQRDTVLSTLRNELCLPEGPAVNSVSSRLLL